MGNQTVLPVSRILLTVLALFVALVPKVGGAIEIDERHLQEIVTLLDEKAAGFGKTINDRQSWSELVGRDGSASILKSAEKLLTEPIPEQSDDLYLDFSKTGNRTRWQRVAGLRRDRVNTLVIAECLENKGRFIKAFEELVGVLCKERTWIMPAHDRELANFKRTSVDIDLGSASLAWSLATADYLLADKLSDKTRTLLRQNLKDRIFDPFEDMVQGKREKNWWMTTTNNWNAVCLAGVTGSALAVLDSPDKRAFYIAAAEYYSRNFLAGFTADGYCSEGLGYWNYGFGYYAMLCEIISQATSGRLDLFDKARQAALFGANIEIINGIYPAFADCSIHAKPSSALMYYVSRRLGLGLQRWETLDMSISGGALYHNMMYAFENSASAPAKVKDPSQLPGIRSWFANAGILICRPGSNSQSRLGVALKGGHNNEHHNHNDVGSYVVVLGDSLLLADPGAEVYTARTFSGRRYESKVLNSFGHPVPIVANQLQKTGSAARAEIVRNNFANETDTLVLDITSAYDVAELKNLQRSFVYSRAGNGSLTVTDDVEFSHPKTFGTAIVTFEKWKMLSPLRIRIGEGKNSVMAEIDSGSSAFRIEAKTIEEDLSTKVLPTRIGIDLSEPVIRASIKVTISPIAEK